MLLAGYEFTSLRPDHIMLAGEKADWDVGAPPLQAVWGHLGNPTVDLPSRFRLASAVLKEVWQTCRLGLKAHGITDGVLAALASAQGGGKIIEALLQNADSIFGIDVVNADAFEQRVVAWLGGKGRIIVP